MSKRVFIFVAILVPAFAIAQSLGATKSGGEYLMAAARLAKSLDESSAAFQQLKRTSIDIQGLQTAFPSSKDYSASELEKLGIDAAFLDNLGRDLPTLPLGIQARPAIVIDPNTPYQLGDPSKPRPSTGKYGMGDPIVFIRDPTGGDQAPSLAAQAVEALKKLLRKTLSTQSYNAMIMKLLGTNDVATQLKYLIDVTGMVSP